MSASGLAGALRFMPVLLFGALAGAFVFARQEETATFPAGYLDRPLPDFVQPPMAGTEGGLSSADMLGEVALLNVFASWCPSCRQEHPMLMRIAQETDVPVYGLNWKDNKGAGKLFLMREGNPYRATGADRDGALGARLNVTGVPETYVIDREGRIRYRHLGPITPEIWNETLLPLVQALRGET